MEKIKLVNNQKLDLIPMGILTLGTKRKFSLISSLGYSEIEKTFSPENISETKYLSSADEPLKTYIDCVVLKSLTKEFGKEVEDGVIADVYSVDLELD